MNISARFVFLALVVLMGGCAAQPKDARWAVHALHRFLMHSELQFAQRAQELMGPMADVDPAVLPLRRASRIEIGPGQAMRYATIEIYRTMPTFYLANIYAIFDTAAVCIKRNDILALGLIFPGTPITIHSPGGGFARLERSPDFVYVLNAGRPIQIHLETFEGQCLAGVSFLIEIPKR